MGLVRDLEGKLGVLNREIGSHDRTKRDLTRDVQAVERRGKQSDPIAEVRRQGELAGLRDRLNNATDLLERRIKERAALDRKIAEARQARDALKREQIADSNLRKQAIDEERRAAGRDDLNAVRRAAREVETINKRMELRAGKIRAAE